MQLHILSSIMNPFHLLPILFLLLFMDYAAAQDPTALPVVDLDETLTYREIGKQVDVLEDPSGQLTFEQVRSPRYDHLFIRSNQATPNFGYSTSHFWIRFKVKNTSAGKHKKWLLETGNPLISSVQFFSINEAGAVVFNETGKFIPIEARKIKERLLLFELDVPEKEERTIFLCVSGNDNKLFKTIVWEQQRVLDYIRQYDIILSVYFGILLALVLYNLFLFFAIFDASYLLYVFFISGIILTQLSVTGFGFQHLGGTTFFNDFNFWMCCFLTFMFGTAFSVRFLNVQFYYPLLYRVAIGYIIVTFLFMTIVLYGLHQPYFLTVLKASSVLAVISTTGLLAISVLIMKKGHRPARYFLIGWSVLLIAVVCMLLKHLGYLPVNWFTTYFVKMATTFEVLVLSLGLADRFHTVTMELKVKTIQSEKMVESEKMKSDFFSNVSHEFRTPLSLILSPLERILAIKETNSFSEQHKMMHRNAKRLLQLVNQLLYLTKLDNKAAKLKLQEEDVLKEIRFFASYFESLAHERQITLHLSFPCETIPLPFDKEKLEIVIVNLLSNAFKFTHTGGSVTLSVASVFDPHSGINKAKHTSWTKITIKDSGIGISPDQLDKIFDRFYQVNNSSIREYEGTGIGLSLVKELVQLHHGKLEVHSEYGKGSEFIVYLPGERHAYATTDFLPAEQVVGETFVPQHFAEETEQEKPISNSSAYRYQILIVEDNADFRTFTKSILQDVYEVIEAVDGQQGWRMAQEKIPDLIVADMMMPKMDGLQLCKKLKEDMNTSHIPVILLTARQASDYKLKGLETGADEYLTKPFDTNELLVRVRNLIEQRKRLREKFSKEGFLNYHPTQTDSANDVFLMNVRATLDKHHNQSAFGVEDFAAAMNMSRTQLHRKLVALTSQSASEVIRNYRLDKAADLLKQKAGNVSEVAYQVGYENLSYFSKAFREKFGQLPSEF